MSEWLNPSSFQNDESESEPIVAAEQLSMSQNAVVNTQLDESTESDEDLM